MNIPKDLKYTKNDEWIKVEGKTGLIGVSDFAQNSLSDVVYVELPESGDVFNKGETFGVVESVKAASDIYMPVSGEVIEVNEVLTQQYELVNKDPYGKAWMIKINIKEPSELDGLMDATAYEAYCMERQH
ncbi:MAG: glycine cleavage system protein GcvH [Anaerolineales bacterium]|jgi:glycine cleavage system H protein|nr:glycine cleavage system protein GcvH [Anaerolineales bacterium]